MVNLIEAPASKAEVRRKANRERQARLRKIQSDQRNETRRLFEFERKIQQLRSRTWPSWNNEFEVAMSALIEQYSDVTSSNQVPAAYNDKQSIAQNTGVSLSAGSFLTDAPHGQGLLVTGGYDSAQIDVVHGAIKQGHGGVEPWFGEGTNRRVRPQGTDPRQNEDGGKVSKGGKYTEDKTPSFLVSLGQDSETYSLTKKQTDLERLIKNKNTRSELDTFWAAERCKWTSGIGYEERRVEAAEARHQSDQWLRRKAESAPTIELVQTRTSTRREKTIHREVPYIGFNVYYARPHASSFPWAVRYGSSHRKERAKEANPIDEEITSLPASKAAD